MILGIGHDMCDHRRIGHMLDRYGKRFSARILTSAEQKELAGRANKPAYLAGRFAVKEAVYKALSSADQTGMNWQQAETLASASGAPILTLSGRCLAGLNSLVPEGFLPSVHVSLSDEPPYSSAFVVISLCPDKQAGQPLPT